MRRHLVALVALLTLVPVGPAVAADRKPDDKFVVSGAVLVDRDETVPGDVVVVDGDILIRGTVKGDVVAVAGDVTVRGTVGGDIVTVAGQMTLGRRANVGGDLVYFDKKPAVTTGATVHGEKKDAKGKLSDVLTKLAIGLWIAFSVSLLLFGIILLLLAPRAGLAIARTAKTKLGMSIGVGIAAFILLPIVAGLFSVSVFATPLGFILWASLIPLYATAYVASALAVGRLILKNSLIPAFLVGFVILILLGLVPFLNALIGVIALIFGLGLIFTTIFRARA